MTVKRLFIAFALGLGLTLALTLALGTIEGWLPAVRAAGFTVTKFTDTNDGVCDADCSLREAIIAANANGEPDTITLGNGTYILSLAGAGEDEAATGDLDITGPLTITGQGPDQTVIDANGIDRAFDIRPGAGTVVISGVTIMGGNVTGDGGGIYNYNADLALVNTHLVSNTATNGGGLYVRWGSATLNGGRIVSNTANTFGGGVYIYRGSVTLSEGEIADNSASSGGGGMYISGGRATLSGGQILGNSARFGAGVEVVNTNAFFIQTGGVISGNAATNKAGGVNVIYGSATLSEGAVISNTAADDGGGLYVSNGLGSLTLVNTTVSGNGAGDDGGGLYVKDGTVAITYTTIANNTAAGGGGEGIHQAGGTVTLLDTIVAHNGAANCAGTLSSNGHNLDDGATCGFGAGGDLTNTDPLLGPLTHEGTTWVHPLLSGSAAIDAGVCVAGITTDQRGAPRPQGTAGKCDIGAYEGEKYEPYQTYVYLPLVLR